MYPFKTLSDRKKLILFLISIFVFYIVLGFQGFDMCDDGFVLTAYQQMFNDPESVQYTFLYYLSVYIGGIWNILFGHWGILGFRLLAALCISATAYFVWRMMHRIMPFWCIVLGVYWSFLCADYGLMSFYHNHLTSLFAVIASFLIYRSLIESKPVLMFAGGFLVGVNVFSRLPNLSLVLLGLVIALYYMHTHDSRKSLLMLLYGVAGFFAGILCIVGLMFFSGHLNLFFETVTDGFHVAGSSENSHGLANLAVTYAGNYFDVASDMLLAMFFPVIACYCTKFVKQCYALTFMVVSGVAYVGIMSFTSTNTYVLYAVSTFACFAIFILKKVEYSWKYLAVIIIINMYALPLGSDFGISNMGEHCVYMSAPLTVGAFYNMVVSLRGEKLKRNLVVLFAFVLAAFVVKRGVCNIFNQCYFDEGCRLDKNYRIDSPLATTYTTRKNCEMLNPLLHELQLYVDKNDYLLCFQYSPTIHYLTHTRPYLYNPWIFTYDSEALERKFNKAETEHKKLPVMVRDKSIPPHWYEPYDYWDDNNAPETFFHKNRKLDLIHSFIARHNYRVVWENEVFQILLPAEQ